MTLLILDVLILLLGLIAIYGTGQSTDTLNYYNTALALYEQYDSLREIAIVCCDLGDVYLKRAEYSQAQAVLRRSLGIAERIGDIPVMSYVFGNMGILDVRTGNLIEAEAEFRSSITLAERIDDPTSVSLWYTYLSYALREMGKLAEAKDTLHKALRIARSMRLTPYISLALVAIGNVHIAQAMSTCIDEGINVNQHKEGKRLLKRAQKSLKHALTLEGMEAEARNEGQLELAQVFLLLGDLEEAQVQVKQALEEARNSELMWLVARALQLSGCIESAQNRPDLASQYFEQALRIFRKSDMRLEQARTLRLYGMMLIEQDNTGGRGYQRGLSYLQDALKVFIECKAELDREMVERFLARHNFMAAK